MSMVQSESSTRNFDVTSALGAAGGISAADNTDGKNDTGETIGGVIGALVGAYFGGPVGASLGYALGSQLGGMVESWIAGDGEEAGNQASTAQKIDDFVESHRAELEDAGVDVEAFKAAMQESSKAIAGYDGAQDPHVYAHQVGSTMLVDDFNASMTEVTGATSNADYVLPESYRADDRINSLANSAA